MRMRGIGDAGSQIVGWIGNAQARHIPKSLKRFTSHIYQDALQAIPRLPTLWNQLAGLEPRFRAGPLLVRTPRRRGGYPAAAE